MKTNLQNLNRKTQEDNWLKSELARLTSMCQGIETVDVLANNVITELAEIIKAEIGTFYIIESPNEEIELSEEKELVLYGSYAYRRRKNMSEKFKIGEGLIGECAKEKKIIMITEVPEHYLEIQSSLGSAKPNVLYLIPIIFEDQIIGVIELGTLNDFSVLEQELVDKFSSTLGITINSIKNKDRTRKLLEKSQTMTEELQSQQEELRATNEEMAKKNKILQDSEEELKTQSEELRAINEELEEKTRSLEQQKKDIQIKNDKIEEAKREIEQKAKDLEVASKYKSEFLANMSHELRTPLNSLLILSKGFADNEDGNLTPEQVEEAQVIYSGGQDLLRLISDILDLSKVEAGKLTVNHDNIPIKTLVSTLQKQFTPIATHHGIEFKVEVDPSLPEVFHSDSLRLEQILKNLLSNAFKFTHQGSVTLKVHNPEAGTKLQFINLPPNEVLAFDVIDTGIGIPVEKQQVIFEAFQQADGSTSRRYGGTGLGLTISRELAKLLNGEIKVKSEMGVGSTFSLFIPLHSIANQTPVPAEVTPSVAPVSAAPPQNIKDDRLLIKPDSKVMLIIEDDEKFAQVLTSLARKKGYLCLISQFGAPGLDLARKYNPKGIILDMGLPDIDGLQVLETLKKDPNTANIPVHVISGYEKQEQALKLGALDFFKKPVSTENLEDAFKQIENLWGKPVSKILVVEDDKASLMAIKKIISKLNINIESSASGLEALDKISNNNYGGIILDLNIKDISGFQVLQQLEKSGKILPPVIVYTSQDISPEEYNNLSKYASAIVMKGENSQERLIDEVSMFIHSVESKLPTEEKHQADMNLGDAQKSLQGQKILLVDDDMRNVFALSKALKRHGIEVETAQDGKIALDKLEAIQGINLVIMDIMMPVMDGYEAMQRIRQNKNLSDLPIIALTAKAMADDRIKCLEAGANDYLTKPVDIDKLVLMLRVWLFR